MIRFINENGDVFDGLNPYVHWINGQLSTGLWYTLKLTCITKFEKLYTSRLDNSIFKFVKIDNYSEQPYDLNDITYDEIESTGFVIDLNRIGGDFNADFNLDFDIGDGEDLYIHQIVLICKSDTPGEYLDNFTLTPDPSSGVMFTINIGVDLYELDETLSINLGNMGMEIPVSIRKAFLENNINEDYVDYALINRKFKELISNYIDISDNRGSYKSLWNSLKWFEWGEGTKLYEIWENDDMFLEKELNPMLSEKYQDLIFTHRKTTHLSLSTALQKISNIEIDDERNPIVEDIIYQWSKEDIMLKISILGAFFERYFMPIHLDLKRVCAESLIFTNQIKVLSGTNNNKYNFHDDTQPVNIEMEHTIVLGNMPMISVGKDTMFGRKVNNSMYDDSTQYLIPAGVDKTEDISFRYGEYEDPDMNDDIAAFYLQTKSGVGAIIPITVSVDLPEDDCLNVEVLNVYKWNGDTPVHYQNPIIERKLIKPVDGKATFTFNLVSIVEEKVSFTLTLYSLSGHVWTAVSSYETVDVRGSYLDVCVVNNTDNGVNSSNVVYYNVIDWINQIHDINSTENKNPYSSLYPFIDYTPSIEDYILTQYIPCNDESSLQFNQLVVIENNNDDGEYDISWINNYINNNFWVIKRIGTSNDGSSIEPTEDHPRYIMLIDKTPGKLYEGKSDFIEQSGVGGQIGNKNIKRFDLIYIPQLHLFTPIESLPATEENYIFTQNDLLCVIPQFKKTLKIEEVSWEYKNMTTLETIKIDQPIIKPLIADKRRRALTPGYWSITMRYRLSGSSQVHQLTQNSAFKIM